MDSAEDVTALLQRFGGDQPELVADKLMAVLYRDLRHVAARCVLREAQGQTLQPTALVHEAYFRLVDQRNVHWESRAHFLSVAALVMRRILTSYARRRKASRRGGGALCVTLQEDAGSYNIGLDDVLAVDVALEQLAKLDPKQAKLVELRYFGGLTVEETAQVMEVSEITVKRQWRSAKAWLRRELDGKTAYDTGAVAASPAHL